MSITLYKDNEYEGNNITLHESDPDFKNDSFNDTISSAIVECGTWQIYSDKDYQGPSVTLSQKGGPNGDGKYPSALFMGDRNDYYSSINLVNSEG